jgi:hypothetical protein
MAYLFIQFYSDILSDIFSGINFDILSDILSGIYSDILSGILAGILFDILFGMSRVEACSTASGAGEEMKKLHLS